MNQHIPKRRAVILGGGIALIGILLLATGAWFVTSRFNIVPNIAHDLTNLNAERPFPAIDETALSQAQKDIIHLLKQEFDAQNPGTKYADGVQEAWCADFVSWIMKEASMPLANPNNGGWRIPGTYTLRDYYESTHRFTPAGTEYQPVVGDVIIYDNPSPFGQHTNIVVKSEGRTVTTVGGNEGGKIRVQVHDDSNDAGLVGYGHLPQ